jgi:two-component system alkaline phosphatase synthesis response regulator PhoP
MGSQQRKILVVDDEEVILELLQYNLEKEGYQVFTAGNGVDAVQIAKEQLPELILMDIMMPGQDGVETCRQIRSIDTLSEVFVIFLTARSEEYSEIAAFEVGADDYITKPIKPRALMSRIGAFYRRGSSANAAKDQLTLRELHIDRTSYTVKVEGKEVVLPKKEFELLYFLMKNPNKVFNRDELLQNIWGTDVYVLARTVDVHIRKIREKVGEDYIKTIKGVGYKFNS